MTQHLPPDEPGSTASTSTGPTADASRSTRLRAARDRDLATHDLADPDGSFFRARRRPWRHMFAQGLGLLLVGLLVTSAAAIHLSRTSGGTLADAVQLPIGQGVAVQLDQGDQRMLYTQRGFGQTRCTVIDPQDRPVQVDKTGAVLLQGSDVLWHGSSMFTASAAGDYTVACTGGAPSRVGRPVGMLDVVLTILAGGVGGIATLTGLGLAVWARRRA